jgi:integrase
MSCAQWRTRSEQFCRIRVAIICQLRRQDDFNGTSQTGGERFAELRSFLFRRRLRRAEMLGTARGYFYFLIERRIIGAPQQEYHVPIVRAILVMIPSINALLAERQKPGRNGGRSNRTVNRIIERANVVFTLAVAEGFVDSQGSRMKLNSKLEEAPKIKLRLSRDSEENILKACRSLGLDYLASATIILLETWTRPLEFFEMKKDRVSLSEGWIRPICYKIGRRRMATAQPKERIVPLTDRARAEFEKLLAQSEDHNVFPYRSVEKSWSTVCKAAGVKGVWLRWLRDEAENHWREAGMHPLDIAYLMGHASPRTTMIYNPPRLEEMLGQAHLTLVSTSRERTSSSRPVASSGQQALSRACAFARRRPTPHSSR